MFKRRYILFITFFVLIPISVLLLWDQIGKIIYPMMGQKEKGTVSRISNLPHIGLELKEFPAKGEIKYVKWEPYGSLYILFSGSVNWISLMNYCIENDWSIRPAGSIDKWHKILKPYKVDPCDFPIAESPKDYEIFASVDNKSIWFQIKISYRIKDERFTAEVYHSRNYR